MIINKQKKMINIEQNKYCVYEHIRKDTNQCFYVGKGTLKRAYNQIRNKHHNRIVKNVDLILE